MLNNKVREVLQKVCQVNDIMTLQYPITTVVLNKKLQAYVDISKYDTEGFETFGVYSFIELNSAINIIPEGNISLENGIINIVTDNVKIQYKTTMLNIIEQECTTSTSNIQAIRSKKLLGRFNISSGNIDKICRASSCLSDLTDLNMIYTDGLYLTVSNGNSKKNDYSIKTSGEFNDGFKSTILIDLIARLPKSDYTVEVYQEGVIQEFVFSADNIDGLSFVVLSK